MSDWIKGTLKKQETRSGYEYEVHYVNKKGKPRKLKIRGMDLPPHLDGKECEFLLTSSGGGVEKLKVEGEDKEYGQTSSSSASGDSGKKRGPAPPHFRGGGGRGHRGRKDGREKGFDADKLVLPKKIQQLFHKFYESSSPRNYLLRLQRGIMWEKGKEELERVKFYPLPPDEYDKLQKSDFPRWKKERQEVLDCLYDQDYETTTLTFAPRWRLVVGLGQASAYETSLTLHHIYGIPYIPASAIKGVTRNWVIRQYFLEGDLEEADHEALEEAGKRAEKKAMADEAFAAVFGRQELSKEETALQGKVLFFDAFPENISSNMLEEDIMNPHYSDYYTGKKKWPSDDQKPVPITFLTVKDTTFSFSLAIPTWENRKVSFCGQTKPIFSLACEWLRKALEEQGIGAKTALGYGHMKFQGEKTE